MSYRTDYRAGQFRILRGYNHSSFLADFSCSEYMEGDVIRKDFPI